MKNATALFSSFAAIIFRPLDASRHTVANYTRCKVRLYSVDA